MDVLHVNKHVWLKLLSSSVAFRPREETRNVPACVKLQLGHELKSRCLLAGLEKRFGLACQHLGGIICDFALNIVLTETA